MIKAELENNLDCFKLGCEFYKLPWRYVVRTTDAFKTIASTRRPLTHKQKCKVLWALWRPVLSQWVIYGFAHPGAPTQSWTPKIWTFWTNIWCVLYFIPLKGGYKYYERPNVPDEALPWTPTKSTYLHVDCDRLRIPICTGLQRSNWGWAGVV